MPQYKKDSPLFRILEVLGHVSLATVDILDILFSGGMRMPRKEVRNVIRRVEKRHANLSKFIQEQKELHRLYNLISKMHGDGLIQKDGRAWKITDKGNDKRLDWSMKVRYADGYLPTNLRRHYQADRSKQNIIVIFDIPEQERSKRDWLRDVLKNLQFKQLQESVMIGQNQIPEQLIRDLKDIDTLKYIQIFTVDKSGTLIDPGE